ncbi:DNA-processing protein DprA [Parvicella tangerina]|uniref:DNA-processing protein DprA n=1 Tax=Parvicella tangerina TaxID=2829795 RepID=UPI00215BEEC3|nr:DNA-processing protein DprA [Parvicella tangerina]
MKDTPEDILYQIALLEMTHVGPVVARKLIDHFGSAKAAIEAQESELDELGDIGKKILSQRTSDEMLNFARAQLLFCENKGAQVMSFYNEQYPFRLKQCTDAPLVLYQHGHCNLNSKRVVSIVGTRNCTGYGREKCAKLVEELQKYDVLIVSGLAFGVDAQAHTSAIENNLYNVAVVAHGLDRVYPSEHRSLANQILQKGAVLTEFPTKTNPDRENFPKRNRIVAGMADAIVVVESAIKGGSMITARLGNDYSRDVFAIPGRIGDTFSAGCNHLIKTNQAHLIHSASDIAYILDWDKASPKSLPVQKKLNFELTPLETKLVETLGNAAKTIDEIAVASSLQVNEVSTQLLMLELRGVVKQLPGKKFKVA